MARVLPSLSPNWQRWGDEPLYKRLLKIVKSLKYGGDRRFDSELLANRLHPAYIRWHGRSLSTPELMQAVDDFGGRCVSRTEAFRWLLSIPIDAIRERPSRDAIPGASTELRGRCGDQGWYGMTLTCLWCGELLTPRITGGELQRFCSTRRRRALDAAARRWTAGALADGRLTTAALRLLSPCPAQWLI